ncbi:LysR substrate-binding domain-containing protein [Leptolyngbya sp. GB1-A1]|uniref:LysR substrate-binding domain-containing protein n=1 Tax=Leptolyngbya sp. GB1-A1 TaxID=2933908 RepID=UPI00329A00CF
MELRHLRYFVMVAEELNFSRAAERLHMAQPPLSQQIRALEIELGVQLFERDKRPLQLTHAGQAFLKQVQLVLTQVEQATQIAQQANRGETGHLAIGVNSTVTQSVLPNILNIFQTRFPQVELILCELDSQAQIQQLKDCTIDCGFLNSPIQNNPDLNSLSILKEPLIVAIHQEHPLLSHQRIPLKALSQEPFILPPSYIGQGLYHQVLNLCQENGFMPTVVQQARWLQTVLSLVAGRIGVALVPASMQNLQRAGVIYKDIQPTFEIETVAVWRPRNPSPVLHKFIEAIRND